MIDQLTNYVAGLPVWVWQTGYLFCFFVHMATLDAERPTKRGWWSLLWPIVTPIYLLAYPLRRLVRWWRRDAQTGESDLGSTEPRPAADSTPHQRTPVGVVASPGWPLQYTAALGNGWPLKFSPMPQSWHGVAHEPDRSKAVRIPTGGVPEKPVSRGEHTNLKDQVYALQIANQDTTARLDALEAKGAKVRACRSTSGAEVLEIDGKLYGRAWPGAYAVHRRWQPMVPHCDTNKFDTWAAMPMFIELPQQEAERLAAECRGDE